MHVHEWLASDSSAPAAGRRLVGGLGKALPEELVDDLQTIVTELVTNSLRHAGLQPGDRIELCVDSDRTFVRIEVNDPGPGFTPPPGPADLLAPGGRGLIILRELSDRWGVKVSPSGCSVWSEIELQSAGSRRVSNGGVRLGV